MGSKKRMMTRAEMLRLDALLKEHLVYDQNMPLEHREVSYSGDMNDLKIAKMVAEDLTAVHSSNFRVEIYGKLRKDSQGSSELETRIQALENTIVQFSQNFNSLCVKYDKLCAALSLNRTVDARHLTTGAYLPSEDKK